VVVVIPPLVVVVVVLPPVVVVVLAPPPEVLPEVLPPVVVVPLEAPPAPEVPPLEVVAPPEVVPPLVSKVPVELLCASVVPPVVVPLPNVFELGVSAVQAARENRPRTKAEDKRMGAPGPEGWKVRSEGTPSQSQVSALFRRLDASSEALWRGALGPRRGALWQERHSVPSARMGNRDSQ
jgi:hypothetical protein